MWWAAVLSALMALGIYLPSLDNPLIYDDLHLVGKDRRVMEAGPIDKILLGDYWPGKRPSYNYRPLTTLSFAWVARLSQQSIFSQRALNLLIYATISLSVCLLAVELGLGVSGGLLAGSLFALHPIHSEAVYMVVGRGELLSTFFAICFFWVVLGGQSRFWLGVLYAGAVFSKESAVMLPVLSLFLFYVKFPRSSFKEFQRLVFRLLTAVLPVLLLLFLTRYQVFGVFLSPPGYVDPLYNPLVAMPSPLRWLNALWVQLLYLKALLWPFPLRADYSYLQIPPILSLGDARLGVGLISAGVGAWIWLSRGRAWRAEWAGIGFFFTALFPVSNLAFTIGVMFGERLTFLPSIGFCLAGAALVMRLSDKLKAIRKKQFIAAVVMVLTVVGGLSVYHRDRDWQTWESFTQALMRDVSGSALAHGLRFLYLKDAGRLQEAEKHLIAAITIYPSYYDAWDSYGDLLSHQSRYTEAIAAYRRAAQEVEKTMYDKKEAGVFFLKAARLEFETGDCGSANESIDQAGKWIGETDPTVLVLKNRLRKVVCEN